MKLLQRFPHYKKEIILLVAHVVDGLVIDRYERLRAEVDPSRYDVMLLINGDEDFDDLPYPKGVYSSEKVFSLGYRPICPTVFPGSCHFTLLAFYLDNPDYRNYWFVEYDVVYTGVWGDFFKAFEEDRSDFISCEIQRYDRVRDGNWPWWTLYNDSGYAKEDSLRGFNPICRYSREALEYLDQYLKEGHSAHSELMVPTALHNAGYRISDIGGEGEFSNPLRRNRHYRRNDASNRGSVRWRPEYTDADHFEPNLLYHPVKNDGRSTTPLGAAWPTAE